jgi:uncharacterized protein
MDTDKIALKPFLISVAGLFFIETAAELISRTGFMPAAGLTAAARISEILFFICVFHRSSDGLASIGLARHQLIPGLKSGLIWSAAFGAAVMIGAGLLFLSGKNPLKLIHTGIPRNFGQMIFFFFLGGFIGPIAEEIFFRGILYGFLRRLGMFVAMFLSSLLFVIAHPSAGLTQTAGGILFAAAYESEGNLMIPITIHILGNTAIFAVSFYVR